MSPLSSIRVRLLRQVLRTPLHPTVSRRFMLLRAIDGTSLSPRVPLRYAVHDGSTVVMARPGSTWWQALSATAPTPCEVRVKRQVLPMHAVLASGEQLDEAVLRYLQKYPGEWKALGIDSFATADDVESAARGQAVIVFEAATKTD